GRIARTKRVPWREVQVHRLVEYAGVPMSFRHRTSVSVLRRMVGAATVYGSRCSLAKASRAEYKISERKGRGPPPRGLELVNFRRILASHPAGDDHRHAVSSGQKHRIDIVGVARRYRRAGVPEHARNGCLAQAQFVVGGCSE